MFRQVIRVLCYCITVAVFCATAVSADDTNIGRDAFEAACSVCHSDEPVVPRAMSRAQMAELPPEKIFKAQTEGLMFIQSGGLNESEKRAAAIYVSKIPWGTVSEEKTAEKLTRLRH